MVEVLSNLLMQALSKSNDTILLDFTQIENLTSNINSLLRIRIDYLNELKIRETKQIVEILKEKNLLKKNHFLNL